MARYFLHLRDGTGETLDPEGQEYASLEILRTAVLKNARDVMSGALQTGIIDLRFRIDAEDARGMQVYTLPFKHAVNIIPEVA